MTETRWWYACNEIKPLIPKYWAWSDKSHTKFRTKCRKCTNYDSMISHRINRKKQKIMNNILEVIKSMFIGNRPTTYGVEIGNFINAPKKKIKIIDLYNKIVKGEEVPKKIGFSDYVFTYNEKDKEYFATVEMMYTGLLTFVCDYNSLNDEIEIIEDKSNIIKEIKIVDNHIIGNWESNNEEYKYTLSRKDVAIIEQINNRIRKINEINKGNSNE